MDSETLIVVGFSAPVVMLLLAAPAMLAGGSALRTVARLGLAILVLGVIAAFLLVDNLGF